MNLIDGGKDVSVDMPCLRSGGGGGCPFVNSEFAIEARLSCWEC